MTNTKLKPFNLEKALAGEKVVTREGKEVTQITKFDDLNSGLLFLAGVWEDKYLITYGINGRLHADQSDSHHDLFMAPKMKTVYINYYSDTQSAFQYSKKEYAEAAARVEACELQRFADAIALPIEIEDKE